MANFRLAIFLLLTSIGSYSWGCNLSNVNLISLTTSGSNYVVTMQVCIGAGRTGVTQGADDATFDFLIAGYRDAGALNMVSFSPLSVTESFTGCNMPAFDVGSLTGISPFDSEANLYFAFDAFAPGCGNGYTCVFSTASCGNIHQDCYNITITYDAMPDSIRVFGVEGAGNPIDGCTPNPDMLIDFTGLPVRWISTEAIFKEDLGVQLDWSFVSQEGEGNFEIERLNSKVGSWDAIGILQDHGVAGEINAHSFIDDNPPPGRVQYRIRHQSPSGDSHTSATMEVNVTSSAPVISPNPFQDELYLQTGHPETVSGQFEILGIDGRSMFEYTGSMQPLQAFQLGDLPAGIYLARLKTPSSVTMHRIMKR